MGGVYGPAQTRGATKRPTKATLAWWWWLARIVGWWQLRVLGWFVNRILVVAFNCLPVCKVTLGRHFAFGLHRFAFAKALEDGFVSSPRSGGATLRAPASALR